MSTYRFDPERERLKRAKFAERLESRREKNIARHERQAAKSREERDRFRRARRSYYNRGADRYDPVDDEGVALSERAQRGAKWLKDLL